MVQNYVKLSEETNSDDRIPGGKLMHWSEFLLYLVIAVVVVPFAAMVIAVIVTGGQC